MFSVVPSTITTHARAAVTPTLDQREQQEPNAQHRDQIVILRNHTFVDHELHEKRSQNGEQLERSGHRQDLRHRSLDAVHASKQVEHRDLLPLLARAKAACRRQLQAHAGEMTRHLGKVDFAASACRIVDHCAPALHTNQHHEVIEVPMQDRGQGQPVQVLQLDLDRTRS